MNGIKMSLSIVIEMLCVFVFLRAICGRNVPGFDNWVYYDGSRKEPAGWMDIEQVAVDQSLDSHREQVQST